MPPGAVHTDVWARARSKREGLPEPENVSRLCSSSLPGPGQLGCGHGAPLSPALPCLSLCWKGSHLTQYSMFQIRLGSMSAKSAGRAGPGLGQQGDPDCQVAMSEPQVGVQDSRGRLPQGKALQAPGWVGQVLGPQPAREECAG